MFRSVTAEKVPLVTLDDATLLAAEKESRKTVATAKSRIVGGSINLLLLSPMAVWTIAKSSKVSHREYWSHEELLKEIQRRKLTVLPKTFDESKTALVGGQLVAITLGHTVGNIVAGDLVGNATSSITNAIAHTAVERTTENAVQSATVSNLGKISEAAAGTSHAPTVADRYSLPENMPAQAVATKHLNGVWAGFGQSEVEPSESQAAPAPAKASSGVKGALQTAFDLASSHVSHTKDAIKSAAASSTPLRTLVTNIAGTVSTTSAALMTVVTGNGADAVTEEFAVPIKYRMKFTFSVNGTTVSGKNVIDGTPVSGKCHESGTIIEWTETVNDDGEELTVSYSARVSGGKMIGIWSATDGRKGTFDLSHL
ncbi:hypothetical protein HDU83_006678 [Entophlyctis luteolus]|nr:hypothetical protein HDU82_002011 [Entophlyctis luteolus]KAJ3341341.1 hypothetical protein HDU83_006678 [Entophlyctis luteolus]